RINLAEHATDQGVGGLAEFLLDEAMLDTGETAAADGSRHVHGVQAEPLRLGFDHLQCVGGHDGGALDLVLERLNFSLHKTTDGVDQEAGVVGQRKIDHRATPTALLAIMVSMSVWL